MVVVDDSIVRGTTSRKIVKMIRDAGASEVHLRISSPPTAWPCYYGIDTPTRQELIASSHTVDEIAKYVTADTLGYLSLEGVYEAIGRLALQLLRRVLLGRVPDPVPAARWPPRCGSSGAEPAHLPSKDRSRSAGAGPGVSTRKGARAGPHGGSGASPRTPSATARHTFSTGTWRAFTA